MLGSRKNVFLVGLVLFLSAPTLHAETEQERRFHSYWADHLPEWCLYTQLLPDQSYGLYKHPAFGNEQARLKTRFGSTYVHVHHYCFGLDDAFEASLIEDETLRRSKYREAIGEFDYVLKYAPDDFVLKSEILVQKGSALEINGDLVGAVDSYTDSIRLNPAYEPAYVALSSCFEELGDAQQALAIIDAGLRRVPRSATLLGKREELVARVSVLR